jgi:hypothetical protein
MKSKRSSSTARGEALQSVDEVGCEALRLLHEREALFLSHLEALSAIVGPAHASRDWQMVNR